MLTIISLMFLRRILCRLPWKFVSKPPYIRFFAKASLSKVDSTCMNIPFTDNGAYGQFERIVIRDLALAES